MKSLFSNVHRSLSFRLHSRGETKQSDELSLHTLVFLTALLGVSHCYLPAQVHYGMQRPYGLFHHLVDIGYSPTNNPMLTLTQATLQSAFSSIIMSTHNLLNNLKNHNYSPDRKPFSDPRLTLTQSTVQNAFSGSVPGHFIIPPKPEGFAGSIQCSLFSCWLFYYDTFVLACSPDAKYTCVVYVGSDAAMMLNMENGRRLEIPPGQRESYHVHCSGYLAVCNAHPYQAVEVYAE